MSPSPTSTAPVRLSGAQILVEYLVRQRVPFAVGIPGHGCWAVTDALLDRQDAIRTIQVMHEQSAVHLADGYYRATGEPILAFTSIGPGAMNTAVGMGTAFVDNSGWISIKGGQESFFGRAAWTDFLRADGTPYSPDFAAIGRAFGLHAEVATRPDEVAPAVRRALASGGPSLVHVPVHRDLEVAGPDKTGWWDAPSPEYHAEQHARWLEGRAEEQHQ